MRLDEFYNLLNILGKLREMIGEVFTPEVIRQLKSKRLRALVQFKKPTKMEELKQTRKSGKKLKQS